jgi:hypothetical protein
MNLKGNEVFTVAVHRIPIENSKFKINRTCRRATIENSSPPIALKYNSAGSQTTTYCCQYCQWSVPNREGSVEISLQTGSESTELASW